VSFTDTITSAATTVQEWSLAALKSGDEAVIDAAKSIAGAFSPLTERLATPVPPVRPLVANWFGFAEKLLTEQKRFSLDLLGSIGTPAPRPTRRSSSTK
jgi:hypothetical protein